MDRCVLDAFSKFRCHNIEPILIKGWAIARYYPKVTFRPSSDVDLAFSRADIEAAYRIHENIGSRGLALDLHNELKHLDTLSWSELYGKSQLVDLDGTPIRVLCPEDHLRVLCVHWLIDGGGFRDRLWDIYYAVENRPSDFDWVRCLSLVSKQRRRWIVCVIGLTNKYLGLNIEDLPFAEEAKQLPKWLVKAVEREWASKVRLLPLHNFSRQPRELFQQIFKRIPPNPIHATVDMEGSFDSRTRLHYQIGTILKRSVPTIKRTLQILGFKFK